jgi:hypothetical protein
MAYTLYLVTYDRGRHPLTDKILPRHWSFFVQVEVDGEKNLGIAHQLRGMPGNFRYNGPEEVDLNKSSSLKTELQIGEVDAARLDSLYNCLKECRIDQSESSGWNCQDWALDGLEKLKAEGFVYEEYTQEMVKNWLKES